ncbi:tyrosine-type recombinase/integrase [Kitasatospora sp. NPDC004669]|uniref:tyrosine-type recombinase/integrase n=1 Tax=Kitasatospora sp. NPDC004669 TaxID=3154555 RepID=UPI0033AD395E
MAAPTARPPSTWSPTPTAGWRASSSPAAPGGSPLRPQWVLDQLRKRTAELEVPRIGLHDLRRTAASIMIAAGIPLAVVSKTLRHSTVAITINLYGHLLKGSADEAAKALASALDHADAQLTYQADPAGSDAQWAA